MTFRVDGKVKGLVRDPQTGQYKNPNEEGWYEGVRAPIEASSREDAEEKLTNEVVLGKAVGLFPEDLETRLVEIFQ